MCGRFALVVERRILELLFQIELLEEIGFRYNIAPTELLPAVRHRPGGENELIRLRWGLVPSWAKGKPGGTGLINIRAETAASKFGSAFRRRRVLLPASGFYEWRREGKVKQPYYMQRQDRRPFAFGGLYENSRREPERPENCAIITTAANSLIEPLHHRMPLIVPEELYPLWLDPAAPPEQLRQILQPFPAEELEAYPVSRAVNSPAFDHPDCIRKES
ncbi:MAG: SOS response-associated peptidase [Firmicutes bacterium]|jgi:putative SOS response-associated peptidase YedK|nr:SOS response-associated peptidase [Bacillota bacterium]